MLSVPGLHCAACIGNVERALNALPGVEEARVNLTLKRVSANSHLPPDALVEALAHVGYEAHPLDTALVEQASDPVGRDLALRMGVAGFAMMNVMLLSVAVWSGAPGITRDFFHLISAAIALPVVAYSGQPFFR
ncbi:MAG: cation transporter, partial [Paracoccaceae bacterium]